MSFWKRLTRKAARSADVIHVSGAIPAELWHALVNPRGFDCHGDVELDAETEAFIRGVLRSVFAKP